jgi:mannose-6-phosphate isomerase-like protein (cupin superfamily)
MKLSNRSKRKRIRNGKNCVVYEYPMKDKIINGAIAEISGRYPEKGHALNRACNELVYVLNGNGNAFVRNKEVKLKTGDMILIEKKEKFYWDGKMTLFMSCVPSWSPKQYVITDK